MKSLYQSTIMLERVQVTNIQQINFHEKTGDNRDQIREHIGNFVQSFIRLFCDVNTLKKLSLKVLYSACKSHSMSYPLSWESS